MTKMSDSNAARAGGGLAVVVGVASLGLLGWIVFSLWTEPLPRALAMNALLLGYGAMLLAFVCGLRFAAPGRSGVDVLAGGLLAGLGFAAIVLFLLGAAVSRVPAALLGAGVLAVPIWDALRGRLQAASAAYSAVLLGLLVSGVAALEIRTSAGPSVVSRDTGFEVVELAEGLSIPWSIEFLPSDGATDFELLVTERNGGIVRIDAEGEAHPIVGAPDAYQSGQGGRFDLTLHPQFVANRLVYLAYASGTQEANRTTLARARLDGDVLRDLEVLFRAEPEKGTPAHFGGRIAFLDDGTLALSLGDGFVHRDDAQGLATDFGKVVRMRDDGSVPSDNPFVGRPDAREVVYSYGHRNVQGLAVHPETGELWAHEHGPKGGDELNRIEPGANYGWPLTTFGVDYNGQRIGTPNPPPGTEVPLATWVPSIAPSGMAFYAGDHFPGWRGDVLMGALRGMHLRRVDLEDGAVVGQEALLTDLGVRIRDVRVGPDGLVYLACDDGRIRRLEPTG